MNESFMQEAIRLAETGMRSGAGGPFGCVIVREAEIVARASNSVVSTCDPTAHAEVAAIRLACTALRTFVLADCELFASCEPCPMCLAAIYWARIPTVYFANTRQDAAGIGFDDEQIYHELALAPTARSVKMRPLSREAALPVFREWALKPDKVRY